MIIIAITIDWKIIERKPRIGEDDVYTRTRRRNKLIVAIKDRKRFFSIVISRQYASRSIASAVKQRERCANKEEYL